MRTSLRKAGYVLFPLVAYVIASDVTRLILMYIVNVISHISSGAYSFISTHEAVISGVIAIIDMTVGTAVLLFIMKKDEWELSIWDYVNLNGMEFYRADKLHRPWVSYLLLVVQGVSAAIGLNALLYLTGIAGSSSGYESNTNSYALPLWFGILLYGFLSPAVEELLHRLVIFGRMKRCFPYGISVIVSSLFFGLYHLNFVQMIYGTLMGILMCLACEYVHGIWGAFIIHASANIVVYVLSSLGVFGKLGTVPICIACLTVAGITIILEFFWTNKSARVVGVPYGVDKVGLFFYEE